MSVQFVRTSTTRIIVTGSSALNNVAGGTMSCWATLDSVGSGIKQLGFLSIGGSNSTTRLGINLNTATLRAQARRLDLDTVTTLNDVSTRSAGASVHVAATADYVGDVLKLFANGLLVATTSPALWVGNTSATSGGGEGIGTIGSGINTADGRIGDLRVYNRALSDAEILGLFIAGGRDSNVLNGQHRWKLNELSPNASVLAARDSWQLRLDGTPVVFNVPVYAAWLASSRRRTHR